MLELAWLALLEPGEASDEDECPWLSRGMIMSHDDHDDEHDDDRDDDHDNDRDDNAMVMTMMTN